MRLEAALTACTALHAAGLMLGWGALALRRVCALPWFPGERKALQAAGLLALASGALWPILQTAVVLDDPAAALDPAAVQELVFQTSFGRTWLGREILVALSALLWLRPGRAEPGAGRLLLAGLALGSLALVGHAAGVGGTAGAVQQAVLAAHLLSAGMWVGALPALALACRRLETGALARVLQRFSGYGMGVVAMLAASGAASALWRMDAFAELWESGYGRALAVKVGFVLAMGALALRNRNALTPALRASGGSEAARGALQTSIAWEAAIGAAVVGWAVVLASLEPPR